MVSTYVLKKLSIWNKIDNLPEDQKNRIERFYTAMSELEFEPEKYGVVLLWSLLVMFTPMLGAALIFDNDHFIRAWCDLLYQVLAALGLSIDRELTPFLLGIVMSIVVGGSAVAAFWYFGIRPERKKIIEELRSMLANDPKLPDIVAKYDPDLIKRFHKLLHTLATSI